MEHRRTVLKKSVVEQPFSQAEGPAAHAPRALRIPAAQVEAASRLDTLEETIPLSGVLRRGVWTARAVPYVMADLVLKPDFPLAPTLPAEVLESSPATAPEQDPALEAAWEARLEEAVERARTEAYEAGYEEGYVAAEAALQAAFEQRKVDLEKDVARLREAWGAFLKQSEPLMATLAFDVVAQLLDAPLPEDIRAVSTQALAQALDQFGKGAPLEITLHPDDYARLQAGGFIDNLEAARRDIRWNAQPSIPVGDWVVQSPDAAIRRLKEEMLTHLKSRLGLPTAMKSRDS